MNNHRVNASIITIGDELLIGQTIDTNSAWMAQELNRLGIWVKRRVAVGDVYSEIWQALDEEARHSQIILITGGLGPTADDITKPLLCTYFGGELVVDQEALANVKNIFTRLGRPMLESNLKQAEVPNVCKVIQNTQGTAPGMWFEKEGKVFISMPGVPYEMKSMMTGYVLEKLAAGFALPAVVHRTLLTAGIGESFLAERIRDFESSLPAHIKLAYLPHFGMVRLRLTTTGWDEQQITADVDEKFLTLQQQLRDVMVLNEDRSLEEAIGVLLKRYNKTLCTAESCTGGYVAHLLTTVPGASAYFNGSIVSYSNAVKQNVLGVDAATLNAAGAVSEDTVIQMALGAKKLLQTDYAVAVSGIMGPGGGSPEKPVGTVWIAVAGSAGVSTQKYYARFDRRRNMEYTAIQALIMVRNSLMKDHNAAKA